MGLNNVMTALADEVRELSGREDKRSIVNMTDDISAANTEIAEQTELIEQIKTVLAGKAAGGEVSKVTEKDVNFWDYDGTLLYSYTLAEAQALSELPAGPEDHETIAFYGWNWTLDAVRALTEPVDIGALYTTRDGMTHLYIRVLNSIQQKITLHYYQDSANAVSVDWGDGSPAEQSGTGGYTTLTHTYAAYGDYEIRMMCSSGVCYLGQDSETLNLFGSTTTAAQYPLLGLLQKVYFGTNTGDGKGAFRFCKQLTEVTLDASSGLPTGASAYRECGMLKHINLCPNPAPLGSNGFYNSSIEIVSVPHNIAEVPTSVLRGCLNLRRFRTPADTVFNGGNQFYGNTYMQEAVCGIYAEDGKAEFRECKSLTKLTLREGQTKLSQQFAYHCHCLTDLTIPSTVTSIDTYAIGACYGLDRLRFLPTTPPTVAATNAFTGIPAACVIEIPAASLDAYRNATNYTGIASQMVGV